MCLIRPLAAIVFAILTLWPVSGAWAKTTLLFFSAPNCPHCAEARPVLHDLLARYPDGELREYDIWKDRESFALLSRLVESFGSQPFSTPAIFVGDRMWLGFHEGMVPSITAALDRCARTACSDPLERVTGEAGRGAQPGQAGPGEGEPDSVVVPFWGELDPRKVSLPLVTLTLGLLDSVNPCAFFVLLFLLGLLVHAHSRRRMLFIGGVFVLFSGLIYFCFMAAWLNLFLLAGQLEIITLGAALIALVVGMINVKDFFFFKAGLSLSISEGSRGRLAGRIRGLVHATSFTSMLLGTVVLAVAANAYELLCTAGFPMVFTRILTLNELETATYYGYLAAYNIIYVLPLLAIVLVVSLSLDVHKLSEWQGRELKLASGMMMLVLGLVLLLRPALMHSLWGAASMLGSALAGTAAIILVYKGYRSLALRRVRKQ